MLIAYLRRGDLTLCTLLVHPATYIFSHSFLYEQSIFRALFIFTVHVATTPNTPALWVVSDRFQPSIFILLFSVIWIQSLFLLAAGPAGSCLPCTLDAAATPPNKNTLATEQYRICIPNWTTHSGLKHTGTEFFFTLYGMKKAKSMNNAHYQIYDANVMLHIVCAHLQIILEGCRSDGAICTRQETRLHLCGRLLKEGLSGSGSSKFAWYHHLQLQCIEVLQIKKPYSCCHDASLSCTDYCKCEGSEVLSYSPFTIHTKKIRRRLKKRSREMIEAIECAVLS